MLYSLNSKAIVYGYMPNKLTLKRGGWVKNPLGEYGYDPKDLKISYKKQLNCKVVAKRAIKRLKNTVILYKN
jgi:hypothetical protein